MFKAYKLSTLVRSNLKQKRQIYAGLVVGIFMAVTFISVISFFLTSLPASAEARHVRAKGHADVVVNDTNEAALKEYVDKKWVSEIGLATVIGNYSAGKLDVYSDFNVASFDARALELLDLTVAEGRLPETSGEIALEYAALGILKHSYKVGDRVTIPLSLPAGDGKIYQDRTFDFDFTLVGLVENKNAVLHRENFYSDSEKGLYYAYPLAIVAPEQATVEGAIPLYTAYLTLQPAFRRLVSSLYSAQFREDYMPKADLVGFGMKSHTFSLHQVTLAVILICFVSLALSARDVSAHAADDSARARLLGRHRQAAQPAARRFRLRLSPGRLALRPRLQLRRRLYRRLFPAETRQ